MRIALPTMGNEGPKEKVHDHFGSASYFTVWDSETNSIEAFASENEHHAHGSCQPLQAIANLRVDAILTGGMGMRAVMICNQGGMKVYRIAGETVQEAVELFKKGELKELTPEMGCQGHDCH